LPPGGKVTLLNCDNLRHNGERFRGGPRFIAPRTTPGYDWVVANTSSKTPWWTVSRRAWA
jgi:D-arabinitol 4-dehydrogenase